MVELPYIIKPLDMDEDIKKHTNGLNYAIEDRLYLCCCLPLRLGIFLLFLAESLDIVGGIALLTVGLPANRKVPGIFYPLFIVYVCFKPVILYYIIQFWRNDCIRSRYNLYRAFDLWIASAIYFQIVYGFLIESVGGRSGGLIFTIIFTIAFIWPQRKEAYRFYECALRIDKSREFD